LRILLQGIWPIPLLLESAAEAEDARRGMTGEALGIARKFDVRFSAALDAWANSSVWGKTQRVWRDTAIVMDRRFDRPTLSQRTAAAEAVDTRTPLRTAQRSVLNT